MSAANGLRPVAAAVVEHTMPPVARCGVDPPNDLVDPAAASPAV